MNIKENYLPLKPDEEVLNIISNCFNQELNGVSGAREKASKLLREHLILTKDGSYTLKSGLLDGDCETMHTHHGAIEEALHKYVIPSKIEYKSQVKILDLCSGLGYNAASSIEYLKEKNPETKINIDMVEISKETMAASLLIPSPLKSYKIIKNAVEDSLYGEGFLKYKKEDLKRSDSLENIKIRIFYDDAREIIKNLVKSDYDVIFLDPFSPSKSPELYSMEFLSKLKHLLKEEGMILSYTSAAPVRSALIKAGFHVGEGPAFGRKGGTIASLSLKNIDKTLSIEDERMVALSDSGVPYRDPQLQDSSSKIRKRREIERKRVRGVEKLPSTVRTPTYLFKDIENPRLKRRVLKNLNNMNINGLKSKKARFIVCPQFEDCICGCGFGKMEGSKARIMEMEKRLKELIINYTNI
ncbi:MAG: MnmC family methyltransferase [Methanobacteriaceae archaeon]|nr:MnmC family methyltransferase [Methanobacteriaceae archaeon]